MPRVAGYDEGWSEEDFHFSIGAEFESIRRKQSLFTNWTFTSYHLSLSSTVS